MWHGVKQILEQLAVTGQKKKSFKLCKYISKLVTADKSLTANNTDTLQTCEISN